MYVCVVKVETLRQDHLPTCLKAMMVKKRTMRPSPDRRNPMTAPERKAHMKAGATPLRASTAVRALAKVAILMPRKPEMHDVMAPSRKAMVLKMPLRSSSSLVRPSCASAQQAQR